MANFYYKRIFFANFRTFKSVGSLLLSGRPQGLIQVVYTSAGQFAQNFIQNSSVQTQDPSASALQVIGPQNKDLYYN